MWHEDCGHDLWLALGYVCERLLGLFEQVSRAQQTPAAAVVLRDVRVIDGTGAPPREHVSLLLRDGRIAAIGGAELDAPAGAEVSDLTGKTVMPGLISAHSHLGLLDG